MPQVRLERGTLAGMRGKASARGVVCNESPDALYRKLKPGPGKDAAEVAGHQQARIHSAMLELLDERGYDEMTVRDLARAAGVSTRSFYKHYSGKEQCFLRVHQLIANRVLRVIETSSTGTTREERIRLSMETIMRAWASQSSAARVLCVDAYVAGPAALGQADWVRRSIEAAIDGSFGDKPAAAGSSLAAEAMVAGAYGATRACILDAQAPPSPQQRWDAMPSKGNVIALLNAAARLAATRSYESLSLPELVEAAGVSRRTFHATFSSLEDCFLTALQQKAADALAYAREASEGCSTPEQGVYRAVVAFCDQVERDASLASLCFDTSVAPGMEKMHSQQVLVGNLGQLIGDRLGPPGQVDRSRAQALAGSIWGVVQNHVTLGRAPELPWKAPLLTHLLLHRQRPIAYDQTDDHYPGRSITCNVARELGTGLEQTAQV